MQVYEDPESPHSIHTFMACPEHGCDLDTALLARKGLHRRLWMPGDPVRPLRILDKATEEQLAAQELADPASAGAFAYSKKWGSGCGVGGDDDALDEQGDSDNEAAVEVVGKSEAKEAMGFSENFRVGACTILNLGRLRLSLAHFHTR